ncbi:glutathione synthase [Novosphingopyxis iocasae]|uniref:glutathione synthase n=1 Tax=Novosphingopyxis iocasae TaxID=2762729 RepID=UPI001651436A|nr:glutathione synthase [Novosphingopyxis iocasae]
MKIAFAVNDVATEQDNYTTIRLARKASAQGHEVALIGLGDFIYDAEGSICAMATVGQQKKFKNDTNYLKHLHDPENAKQRICVEDYDVLMLRSDPAEELGERDWAPPAGLLFAQVAASHGVIVLNDPENLTDAVNKTYFQNFPEEVRAATCITREANEIKSFLEKHDGKGVIKPLQGSGGQGVFIIDEGNKKNLNQIIEAVTRDGLAIIQEYLPAAAEGDVRMITLNGRPLKVDNCYAIMRRFSQSEDMRSNISAGGGVEMIEPTDDMLKVAEIVGPKLIDDGMYLAGLDIAGDKMMEVNVDTPGGLSYIEDLTDVDFSKVIIEDLARKVRLQKQYGGKLTNRQLAVI